MVETVMHKINKALTFQLYNVPLKINEVVINNPVEKIGIMYKQHFTEEENTDRFFCLPNSHLPLLPY